MPNDAGNAPDAAMSIDVEDWFQVQNLAGSVPRDSWERQERRVEANTRRMLDIMERTGARSTCFVLGWVAERHPELVREIAARGHEVASHGHGHELIYEIGPERFREDVRRSKAILEDIVGTRVEGYRAPNFSITDWAIDILAEEGYAYDSSSFPVVAHDRYGRLSKGGGGKAIYEIAPGLREVCVSALDVAGKGIPWGGGGWFRLIPYPLFSAGVSRFIATGQPYVFYIHPWEIDPGQPRVRCAKRSHGWRHYMNLGACAARWERLLASRRWCAIRDLLVAGASPGAGAAESSRFSENG
jgi:polysaccharide deacetylase family protein (PEP-CTERM system associated)